MATNAKHTRKRSAQRKRTKRTFNPSARLWSKAQCAAWSGLPPKTITRLVKAGVIPAIAVGAEVEQILPNGARRTRACNRYMILSKPFIAWFEGLSAGDRLTMTKATEAA
jgi:hypothetical protein